MIGRIAFAVLAVGLLALLVSHFRGNQVAMSGPAPDFTLTDLRTGEQVTLSSLRGKPVLLDVFATW